jgi:hypothetical protein
MNTSKDLLLVVDIQSPEKISYAKFLANGNNHQILSVSDSFDDTFLANDWSDTTTTKVKRDTSTGSQYQLELAADGVHEPYSDDESGTTKEEDCFSLLLFDHRTFDSRTLPLVGTVCRLSSAEGAVASKSSLKSENLLEVTRMSGRSRGVAIGTGSVRGLHGAAGVDAEIGVLRYGCGRYSHMAHLSQINDTDALFNGSIKHDSAREKGEEANCFVNSYLRSSNDKLNARSLHC